MSALEVLQRSSPKFEDFPFTFDFVERLYPHSKIFELEGGGAFMVAPEDSLLPRFVIDVQIPDLATLSQEQIGKITWQMNEQSSGFLWFTSEGNLDSYMIAWKARLSSRPMSSMFGWSDHAVTPEVYSTVSVEPLRERPAQLTPGVIAGLTARPPQEGGLSERNLAVLAEKGGLLGVYENDELVGAMTRFAHRDGTHVTVGGIIASSHHGRGLEGMALSAAADRLHAEGKQMVVGMPNTDQPALQLVSSLGMSLIRKGWTAQLGTF